jgi:putative Holliday junction resolvase
LNPRISYHAWLHREDLNELAKRLYHTVALKRAQATWHVQLEPDSLFKPHQQCRGIFTWMKEAETTPTDNPPDSAGRLLALDLGTRRVGVAVSDELRITVNPLPAIERRSWKDLLRRVASVIESYDAQGLVIGLPLSLTGAEGSAAQEARATARKFQLSLRVPVYLQDERLTTVAATAELRDAGRSSREIEAEIDSEAARVILNDFIAQNAHDNLGSQIQRID